MELVRHMTSVMGYARTFFRGGRYRAEPLDSFAEEIARFHSMFADLTEHLERGDPLQDGTPERLLQGPLWDAMTHAGQLAMLRRPMAHRFRPRTLSSPKSGRRTYPKISHFPTLCTLHASTLHSSAPLLIFV